MKPARQDRVAARARQGAAAAAPCAPLLTRSQPCVIDGCAGWLHEPPAGFGDVAVLLCPGLGWDGLRTHVAFRQLADEIAGSGFWALRLAYPGTGDSADLEPGTDPWACWLASVSRAADWLLATSGAQQVVFAGFRIGAALATLAACRRVDAAGLLLIAPVIRGRAYLKQVRVQAELESGSRLPPGTLDYLELSLPAASQEAIAAVDLRSAPPRPGLAVAICAPARAAPLAACIDGWTAAGAAVRCLPFEGLEPLLRIDIFHNSPAPAFDTVLGWLRGLAPARAAPGQTGLGRPGPGAPASSLTLPGCTESPWRFGSNGRLFGVFCRPTRQNSTRAVVIVNTGRDPRHGPGRFAVGLARGLAGAGIASLRMDFAGLGDSPGLTSPGLTSPGLTSPGLTSPGLTSPGLTSSGETGPGLNGADHRLSAMFDDDRTADIAAAIDRLEQSGFRQIALHGLCSGAYHAFAAAQSDHRISCLLLVNLPVFHWVVGDNPDARQISQTPPAAFIAKLGRAATYGRLIRGQLHLGRVAHGQGKRLIARLAGRSDAAEAARRGVAALTARGVRTLLLYAPGDPGLTPLHAAFGPEGGDLAAYPGVVAECLAGIDHTLSTPPMRAAVAARIEAFINEERACP